MLHLDARAVSIITLARSLNRTMPLELKLRMWLRRYRCRRPVIDRRPSAPLPRRLADRLQPSLVVDHRPCAGLRSRPDPGDHLNRPSGNTSATATPSQTLGGADIDADDQILLSAFILSCTYSILGRCGRKPSDSAGRCASAAHRAAALTRGVGWTTQTRCVPKAGPPVHRDQAES